MAAVSQAQRFLDRAIDALADDQSDWRASLDLLPVPIYTTDAEGLVTFWNRACIDFAGREPELGKDRWCVTWRIHTTADEHLPHDRCPMAVAIRERREVRGTVGIAMRPDGSRKAFTPFPTPLYDESGELSGAINLLLDVSGDQASALADQAARCQRLSQSMTDSRTRGLLETMAEGYRRNALALAC